MGFAIGERKLPDVGIGSTKSVVLAVGDRIISPSTGTTPPMPTPVSLASIANITLMQGETLTVNPVASDGTTPYTWSLTDTNNLGATINSSTGAISYVIPTDRAARNYSVTITVTDANMGTASVTFTVTVTALPTTRLLADFTASPRGTGSSYVQVPNPASAGAVFNPASPQFTHKGVTYTITQMDMLKSGGQMRVHFNAAIPDSTLDAVTIQIGMNTNGDRSSTTFVDFPFTDIGTYPTGSTPMFTWSLPNGQNRWKGPQVYTVRIIEDI